MLELGPHSGQRFTQTAVHDRGLDVVPRLQRAASGQVLGGAKTIHRAGVVHARHLCFTLGPQSSQHLAL